MHNHAFSDDTNQVKWHESCESCANLTHLPTKRSPACPEPRMDTRATCICMTSPPDRTDGETHLRPLLRPCAHPKRSAASVGVHLTSPSQPNEPSLRCVGPPLHCVGHHNTAWGEAATIPGSCTAAQDTKAPRIRAPATVKEAIKPSELPRCHTKCGRAEGLTLCNACTITARLRPPTDRVPPSRPRASLACNHSKLTKTQPLCHASKERLPEPCSRFGNKQAGTQSASLRRQVHAPSRSRLRPRSPGPEPREAT